MGDIKPHPGDTTGNDMKDVAASYDRNPEAEWDRLVKEPYRAMEFEVTMHHIRKHFPPRGHVLDVGGGPGRYSLELCRLGYHVTLFDLSPGCIRTAKEKLALEEADVQARMKEFMVGDVRDLSRFDANTFDAILCLDPISYLSQEADRRRAVSELTRLARKGATVAVSVRGYLAALRTMLANEAPEIVTEAMDLMELEGNTLVGDVMCHFSRAGELRTLCESAGLETIDMAGCEGLSTGLREATNRLEHDEAKWRRWLELATKYSTEPAVVDMGEHILYIGRPTNGS